MSNEIKEEIEKVLEELLNAKEENKIQMFDCYDLVGDEKVTLYNENGIEVLYAPFYEYVELIGMSEEDYNYFFEKYGY